MCAGDFYIPSSLLLLLISSTTRRPSSLQSYLPYGTVPCTCINIIPYWVPTRSLQPTAYGTQLDLDLVLPGSSSSSSGSRSSSCSCSSSSSSSSSLLRAFVVLFIVSPVYCVVVSLSFLII